VQPLSASRHAVRTRRTARPAISDFAWCAATTRSAESVMAAVARGVTAAAFRVR
jgi:hypothetical protein